MPVIHSEIPVAAERLTEEVNSKLDVDLDWVRPHLVRYLYVHTHTKHKVITTTVIRPLYDLTRCAQSVFNLCSLCLGHTDRADVIR